MDRIDRILPTLATKADLHEQIAAVGESLSDEIRLLAEGISANQERIDAERAARERAEVAGLARHVETRRHMDAVGESLRDEIRLLAEGISANQERIDAERVARERVDAGLDRRVTRLEAARRPRRK